GGGGDGEDAEGGRLWVPGRERAVPAALAAVPRPVAGGRSCRPGGARGARRRVGRVAGDLPGRRDRARRDGPARRGDERAARPDGAAATGGPEPCAGAAARAPRAAPPP